MRNANDSAGRKQVAWGPLLAFALCTLLAPVAHAVPLVVERLDGAFGVDAAAALLAGRHDAAFIGEDYAAITPAPFGRARDIRRRLLA